MFWFGSGYNPLCWLNTPLSSSNVVLEPDAVKVASPVLRGGWVSNDLSLPSVRHESLWFVLVTSIKEVIVSHSEQSPSGARPDLFKMSEGGNAEDVTEKPKFTLGWTVK